jgi:predicted RNA-binding protein with PUA domain
MGGLKDSKRMYLMRRLFQFSDLVWRIGLDDQGTKMILEKGIEMVSHCERSEAISRDCFVAPRLRDSSQ